MRRSINLPIYSQVAFDIAAKIAAGEIKEGQRFTGRSLMGTQYEVSSETIRRAMRDLGNMGIISVQAKVGSTVLSQKRAVEYVEQYQAGKDLRVLKNRLRDLTAQRDSLNEEINQTFQRIVDLTGRFRYSDSLRTYEFTVEASNSAAGRSIGDLEFRQKTGATIVAVRKGDEVLLSPGPKTKLEPGDVVVVASELTHIGQVSELLGRSACDPKKG